MFTAWNATVSGRLKSDFHISAEVTYNNFPWPSLDDAQKSAVSNAAHGVIAARAAHPSSTLADLYDPLAMPVNLVKAHRDLDRVVLGLYGLKPTVSDADLLAALFTLRSTDQGPGHEVARHAHGRSSPPSRPTSATLNAGSQRALAPTPHPHADGSPRVSPSTMTHRLCR